MMKAKNIYAVLSIILASGSLVFALRCAQYPGFAEMKHFGLTKQEISSRIMNAHERLFDGSDLSIEFNSNWVNALGDLGRYVDENAKGNPKLMITAALVQEEGIRLPLNIKSDFTRNPQILSSYLSATKIKLQEKAKVLENTTFWIDRQQKNNAKEVLLAVIGLLEETIRRVMNDLTT